MRATIFNAILAAGLLGPAALQPAAAGDQLGYPRIVGSGEDVRVEYGPGPQNNIVGGGHAQLRGAGEDMQLSYSGAGAAQRTPAGMVPVLEGSGESVGVAWIPASEPERLLAGAGR